MADPNLEQRGAQLELDPLKIGREGIIVRGEDGVARVYVSELSPDILQEEGVTCVNPEESDPRRRIYTKAFSQRTVFLPDELERAQAEVLGDVQIRFGMTGFSDVRMDELGLTAQAYEAAAARILATALIAIVDRFRDPSGQIPRIGLVHGGLNKGVDQAVIEVANQFGIPTLAFNCPRYMLYMRDSAQEHPIYVSPTVARYSQDFIANLNVLISSGGRDTSLQHDIDATVKMLKPVIYADFVSMLTNQVRLLGLDGKILNATAAFLRLSGLTIRFRDGRPVETIEALHEYVRERALEEAVRILAIVAPDMAFGDWRNAMEERGHTHRQG